MDAESKFAAMATGQVALLGALVAIVGTAANRGTPPFFNVYYPMDPAFAGPVAVFAADLFDATLTLVALSYVLVPVAVGGYAVYRDPGRAPRHLAWTACALLGIPVVLWVGEQFPYTLQPMGSLAAMAAVGASPLLVAAAFWTDRETTTSPAVGLGVVAVVVFLVAALVGGQAAGGAIENAVESHRTSPPSAAFEFTHYPGNDTVVVTHDGGDAFLDGSTEGLRIVAGNASRRVSLPFEAGDGVAVSVPEDDETVRVVWEYPGGDRTEVLATHDLDR